MKLEYVERIFLKETPEINEALIQKKIEETPSILGLGDLDVISREISVPSGGRIDILLENPEENKRFIVEVQLGKLDESHIVRSIEYWEFMRRLFPHYDYTVVLIAEDVSRFLNVISIMATVVPFVVIQLVAFKVKENIGFCFSKIFDGMPLSVESLEEEIPANENYWKNKASEESLNLANEILQIINNEIAPGFSLKYTKHYIGLENNGITKNFVSFVPRKKPFVILELKHSRSKEIDELIENYGFQQLNYDNNFKLYKLRIRKEDLKDGSKRKGLIELLKRAYEYYFEDTIS